MENVKILKIFSFKKKKKLEHKNLIHGRAGVTTHGHI